ncbi:sensor histidine kinase [Paenibacillus arenilitoris]|uniref:histidine kinase n=1 Tax=Paenibacillus arenilitoris TaxID=2772299 RepID=A0A927CJF3_9BACL|nr:sensor histidine kinase [Paenibacillus arenilitoris]MBD2868575.1 sensor histidine kinase [Paenibacillus arenilitoris]
MRLLRKATDGIRHMRIVPKLIIGYIVLIFIPFTLFGFFFYRQMYSNLLVQYQADRVKLMDQSLASLGIELSKAESTFPLFQNNDQLLEYLDGQYRDDWEMVYNYRKGISPTFQFIATGNPNIASASIYSLNPAVLSLEPDIRKADDYSGEFDRNQIDALAPNEGAWFFENADADNRPIIHYTRMFYNDTYTRELGFLQIEIKTSVFDSVFDILPAETGTWNYLADGAGRIFSVESSSEWTETELESFAGRAPASGVNSFYTDNNRYLVHVIAVPKLGATMIKIGKVGPILTLQASEGWSIAGGVLLLALLSVLYFMIASSLGNRLLRFMRHLKRVDHPKLAVYDGPSGTDEIGFVINSYNAMIKRMDELTEDMHQTEMLKKEAEIKMLHAQIKPHFLYNTLETMRMMALVKEEKELAEVASSLGNLLRYSLVKNADEATLSQELENVLHYIEIHKVRMGERLSFTMDIQGETGGYVTPRFILQPIVENCILHGLGQIRGKGIIELSVREERNVVLIRVIDNGAGMSPERLQAVRTALTTGQPVDESAGIGLRNVNERIKSFCGGESGITVDSTPGKGTTFAIRLEKERR